LRGRAGASEEGGEELAIGCPMGYAAPMGWAHPPFSRLLIERGTGERDAMRSPGALLLRYERPRRRAGVKGDKAR